MQTEQVATLLIGSSGITAILVAIITALVNRRKLSAEATSIISQAAGGLVENLNKDNLQLRADKGVLQARLEELEESEKKRDKRDRAFRRMLDEHSRYDKMVWKKLQEAGIETPEPPPLHWIEWDESHSFNPTPPGMGGTGQ